MAENRKEIAHLPCDQLRWRCNPDIFHFETTAEVDCNRGVIGQDTARDALMFGIQCDAPGQNIYVRGARGTGRIRLVRQLLQELQPSSNNKRDYCYVHNFQRPDHPRLITLPPGTANDFRRKIEEIAEFIQDGLIKALSGEPYQSRRQAIHEEVQNRVRSISEPLEKELAAAGLALVTSQQMPRPQTMIFPVVDGQPVPPDQLKKLVLEGTAPEEQLKSFENAFPEFQKKLKEIGRAVADAFRESKEQVDELHETAARQMLSDLTDPLLAKYPFEGAKAFVKEMVDNTIEYHLQLLFCFWMLKAKSPDVNGIGVQPESRFLVGCEPPNLELTWKRHACRRLEMLCLRCSAHETGESFN